MVCGHLGSISMSLVNCIETVYTEDRFSLLWSNFFFLRLFGLGLGVLETRGGGGKAGQARSQKVGAQRDHCWAH
jgi:hypothetical protein